jgi:hypothetical protein
MGCVYVLAAITLTVYIVTGVMEGLSECGLRAFLKRASAWCLLVGGGTYGLGVFDSGLIPGFNWYVLGTVIVCSFVALVIARITGRV